MDMEKIFGFIKKLAPREIFAALQPIYHYLLALIGALIYRFPSSKIKVIAVTGTKGKSSVVELTNAILEEAGFATALANTIRFKIRDDSRPNMYKMTMPGRFFLQNFLRMAITAGCTHAIIEMTSEGARQFRHKFIELDALIFTNLASEHIESHGSYEKYVAAKVSLAEALEKSPLKKGVAHSDEPRVVSPLIKGDKILVVNGDDKEAHRFLEVFTGTKISYSKNDADNAIVSANGISFDWNGIKIQSKLPGEFNLYNILAAVTFARAANISDEKIKAGIEKITSIRGRTEKITLGEIYLDFTVIVDYAHTPDSLEKLYQTYAGKYRRCVLGNTGGGRDAWKRPVMAGIAERYCDEIILTNEDPYDEDPEKIIREMAAGMKNKRPAIILDRRTAIRTALQKSSKGDIVLITGKGTDPYIMGPKESKEPWDDATVVREEMQKLHERRNF